jgi:hypothetical protein
MLANLCKCHDVATGFFEELSALTLPVITSRQDGGLQNYSQGLIVAVDLEHLNPVARDALNTFLNILEFSEHLTNGVELSDRLQHKLMLKPHKIPGIPENN